MPKAASLPLLLLCLSAPHVAPAAVTLEAPLLNQQPRLVEFANFFRSNMAGKIFFSANRDRPYQDKIIDYEYDVSYFDLQLDPAGGLTFKSTYNIKRLIYSADPNGKKTGEATIKQNTQTSQCALRQMTRTTNDIVGHCHKIADNAPNASILGLSRQVRVLELNAERMVWKDNSVGYLEGFLLDKQGYSPQHEIQTVSFERVPSEQGGKQTLMKKKTATYTYDIEKDQVGGLLTETTAETLASQL